MAEVSSMRSPSEESLFSHGQSLRSPEREAIGARDASRVFSHVTAKTTTTSTPTITHIQTCDSFTSQPRDGHSAVSNRTGITPDGLGACNTPCQQSDDKRLHTRESIPMNSLSLARQLGPGSSLEMEDHVLDMICVGFGPASLAIAIALADRCAALPPSSRRLPRVLFLDKQIEFAWHAGMQLPDAHMQISFLKDLATPRDPTSPFSFINYLHSKGRLQKFINLGTFLPARKEYEDYMRWCAEHFENSVCYGREITKIEQHPKEKTGLVDGFRVRWDDLTTGQPGSALARHVVVATGGRPFVPEIFKPFTTGKWPRFQHSSQYATVMEALEKVRSEPEAIRRELEVALDSLNEVADDVFDSDSLASQMIAEMGSPSKDLQNSQSIPRSAEEIAAIEKKIKTLRQKYTSIRTGLDSIGLGPVPERFVIIGGGQSAAEIYMDLQSRFPQSEVYIVVKGASLRPSDDSPFVNEIFDPDRVDGIYAQAPAERQAALRLDKATNYGVVRLGLLESIYERLYLQQVREPDETRWRCRVLVNRSVVGVERGADGRGVVLELAPTSEVENGRGETAERETIKATMVFYATGYVRDAHEEMLRETRSLLLEGSDGFAVARDYRVIYDEKKIDSAVAGVWLQGCNEKTHGLSDTLLSILAHRGGDMVQSIFGSSLEGEA